MIIGVGSDLINIDRIGRNSRTIWFAFHESLFLLRTSKLNVINGLIVLIVMLKDMQLKKPVLKLWALGLEAGFTGVI